jgi:hypothetical protein
MPTTRSGLSFDPAAFHQVPLNLLDPEPAKPIIPAAEPTGYISPLYDPTFEVLPLEDPTSPGYYSDVVFPPAVQYDLCRKIAEFLNNPPYEPTDTEPPHPMDPMFETYFAAGLYRHEPPDPIELGSSVSVGS